MGVKAARRTKKSIVLRLLVVAFCLYLCLTCFKLYKQFVDAKADLAEVNDQMNETQLSIDEANNLLNNTTGKEIVEWAAREKLGYAYADEKVYVDANGN